MFLVNSVVRRASGKSKMASPLFKNYPSTEHFNWNIIRNLSNTPCLGKRRILQLWIRGLLMYQKFILEWVETLKYLNIADQWDTMKQKSSGTSPIPSYFNKWDFLNWTIAWRVLESFSCKYWPYTRDIREIRRSQNRYSYDFYL